MQTDQIKIFRALCSDGGEQKSDWHMLVPAGAIIYANDGRWWRNSNPDEVIENTVAGGLKLPIDINHGIEYGSSEPAQGWITELENRDGAIWGLLEWTNLGAESLDAKHYRYLSPAFTHDADQNIIEITSAALVTKPALVMPAVASRQVPTPKPPHAKPQKETNPMDPEEFKALCASLGLSDTASVADVMSAVAAQKPKEEPKVEKPAEAPKAQDPVEPKVKEEPKAQETADIVDLTKFVPRADYDAVVAKLNETESAKNDNAVDPAEVDEAIQKAVASARIAPASAEFYKSACSTKAGLAAFRDMVAITPAVVPTDDAAAPKVDGQSGKALLSAAQKEMIALTGVSEDQFIATLKKEQANA